MKIDLTTIPLEEVRNLVMGTEDGRAVRIYANDGGDNEYPIHAAYQNSSGDWYLRNFDRFGQYKGHQGLSFKLKPKTIDFTKLPVDTLVRIENTGRLAYTNGESDQIRQEIGLFKHGASSKTALSGVNNQFSGNLALAKNKKIVWDGKTGKCPLPDGVEVRVGLSNGMLLTNVCTYFDWNHYAHVHRILWYQITGNIV